MEKPISVYTWYILYINHIIIIQLYTYIFYGILEITTSQKKKPKNYNTEKRKKYIK